MKSKEMELMPLLVREEVLEEKILSHLPIEPTKIKIKAYIRMGQEELFP
jgi:hypothetical protein